jgi:hypothetical protein
MYWIFCVHLFIIKHSWAYRRRQILFLCICPGYRDPGINSIYVACALQKEIHFREDCFGEERKLFYIKDKEGKEIDFCIASDNIPSLFLEVKWNDDNLSPNFQKFIKMFPGIKMVQISKLLKREKTYENGAELRHAPSWLSEFTLP